jgi:hypothetical protein
MNQQAPLCHGEIHTVPPAGIVADSGKLAATLHIGHMGLSLNRIGKPG